MLHLGTSSKNISQDRRLRLGLYSLTRLDKYIGAVPSMQLKQITKTLYLIRSATGSQCKCFKMGVILDDLLEFVISLAAQFCTF